MVDISATDSGSGMSQMRDRYDKQKEDLREEYDQELSELQDRYQRREHQETKEGDAAVNHIQAQVKTKIQTAEKNADDQEKALDSEIALKQDHLRKRQASQEAYLEQAKKRHASWVDGEGKELESEKQRINDRTDAQIKNTQEISNHRLLTTEKRVADESRRVHDNGEEQLAAVHANSEKRLRSLERHEEERYHEAKDAHEKELSNEKYGFRSGIEKSKTTHAQAIASLHEEEDREITGVRRKNEADIKHEHTVADKRLKDTETRDQFNLGEEKERNQKSEEIFRNQHREQLNKLDAQTKKETQETQSRHKKDMDRENQDYEKRATELKTRHEEQRRGELAMEKVELERIDDEHTHQLSQENVAFEQKYSRNDELAREAYANQGLTLGRELVNQKKQFVRAADKYSGKENDPFYQIRDNKTHFSENSGAYVLKARVPEHLKDNVQVKVKGDKVILSGNRSFNDEIVEDNHIVRTNNVQTFHEMYDIPKKILPNQIVQNYEGGVLTVTIPKVT